MEQHSLWKPVQLPSVAEIGAHVIVELTDTSGQGERLEFDIVPDERADLANGFLGSGTPLARAICGHPAGHTIPYHQADIVSVRILSVVPAQAAPDTDPARQREAVLRRAREEAERTDAIVFASSFSGKWGDYDPGGMEHWDRTDEQDGKTGKEGAGS